jgi:hypothetical protein
VQLAQTFHAREESPLAIVKPLLDVKREDVPPARRPDPEGDRDRVVRLVADGERDPLHAELFRARRGTAVQADRGLARRQPLDLDVAPADPADAEPEHLRDGFLGGPPTRERLGPETDVALFERCQDARGEALPEPLDRRPDPLDLDDVDAELRGARGRRDRHGAAATPP